MRYKRFVIRYFWDDQLSMNVRAALVVGGGFFGGIFTLIVLLKLIIR